jgi:FkbM family methyltransferase
MTNFFRTLSTFRRNTFINPYVASLKHVGWAIRKVLNHFPCDLRIGSVTVRIASRSIANGVGSLLNAMGYYDPNNMYLIEDIFKKRFASVFLDIGANVGVYSLIAAASEDVRVVAFEPHPVTFSFLEENVRINHKEKMVSCHQIALGDMDGDVPFQDSAGNPENRILTEKDLGVDFIRVTSRRGDSFCAERGICPEIMKIDVEGFEDQVLKGFGKLLLETKVIFVECWDPPVITGYLCEEVGFMGPYKVDYRNRKLVHDDIHYEDWVFINSQAITSFCAALGFEFPGD